MGLGTQPTLWPLRHAPSLLPLPLISPPPPSSPNGAVWALKWCTVGRVSWSDRLRYCCYAFSAWWPSLIKKNASCFSFNLALRLYLFNITVQYTHSLFLACLGHFLLMLVCFDCGIQTVVIIDACRIICTEFPFCTIKWSTSTLLAHSWYEKCTITPIVTRNWCATQ